MQKYRYKSAGADAPALFAAWEFEEADAPAENEQMHDTVFFQKMVKIEQK